MPRYRTVGPLFGGAGSRAQLALQLPEGDAPPEPRVLIPLHVDVIGSAEAMEAVRRETRRAQQLEHPHITRVYGLSQEPIGLCRVVEYADGEPVRALLEVGGPMAPELAVRIAADAALALHYAHLAGNDDGQPLVHGDLRPETLLVTYSGLTKVGGYGALAAAPRETRGKRVRGRRQHCAPEQIIGGRNAVTVRSDVYLLGVLLHELLSGEVPFTNLGKDFDHAVLALPPPPLPVGERPPGLEPVIHRAMAKKAGDRYPTALAFREALEQAVGAFISHEVLAAYVSRVFPENFESRRAVRTRMLDEALAELTGTAGMARPATRPISGKSARSTRPVVTPTGSPGVARGEGPGGAASGSGTTPPRSGGGAPASAAAPPPAAPATAATPRATEGAAAAAVTAFALEPVAPGVAPAPAPLREPAAPAPHDALSGARSDSAREATAPSVADAAPRAGTFLGDAAPQAKRGPGSDATSPSVGDAGPEPTPTAPRTGDAPRAGSSPARQGSTPGIAADRPVRSAHRRRRSLWPVALGTLLVVAAVAAGAYAWFRLRPAGAPALEPVTATPDVTPDAGVASVAAAAEAAAPDAGEPLAVLDLLVDPAVDVTVDGEPVGRAPLKLQVKPGRRRLGFTDHARGIATARVVDVPPQGTSREFYLGRGYVNVFGPEGAQVVIDGRPYGAVPLTEIGLYEGSHRIVVTIGPSKWQEAFELVPNQRVRFDVDFE